MIVDQAVLPVATLRKELAAAFDQSRLSLIVSPTEKCNFRCTYCYEDFALGKMSAHVYNALKLYVAKQMPRLRLFSLSWFGGEPLLCADMVEDFTAYCRGMALQYGVRMPATAMTTNAYKLTLPLLQRLVAVGIVGYQVSLDGEAKAHDLTRKLAGGRGTFDRIYANLLAAREIDPALPLAISIRLHLHEDNVDSQIALTKRIAQDFGPDARFSVFPKRIGDLGGTGVKKLGLLDSSADVEAQVLRIFNASESATSQRRDCVLPSVCYASKPNNLFVRPTGRIAKCTVALDSDDNDIGRLNEDGELELDTEKALLWCYGFQTGEATDLSCPLGRKATVAPLRSLEKAPTVASSMHGVRGSIGGRVA